MREDRLSIGDIPARLYTPRGASGLLLLGHGGGQSKDAERFVLLSRFYAEQTGLSVVCMDAVDHGERRPAGPVGGLPDGWHSRTSPQMVEDWNAVVDNLSSAGPAVAYVGFSMGSVFGIPVVAAIPTIASAAVFVVGAHPLPGDRGRSVVPDRSAAGRRAGPRSGRDHPNDERHVAAGPRSHDLGMGDDATAQPQGGGAPGPGLPGSAEALGGRRRRRGLDEPVRRR